MVLRRLSQRNDLNENVLICPVIRFVRYQQNNNPAASGMLSEKLSPRILKGIPEFRSP